MMADGVYRNCITESKAYSYVYSSVLFVEKYNGLIVKETTPITVRKKIYIHKNSMAWQGTYEHAGHYFRTSIFIMVLF